MSGVADALEGDVRPVGGPPDQSASVAAIGENAGDEEMSLKWQIAPPRSSSSVRPTTRHHASHSKGHSMVATIRMTETGGPDVLKLETGEQALPGPGEVWLEQDAIGVNYLDITQRNGGVLIPLPSGLGLKGAGRVGVIGIDVTNVAVGDRVAYILGPLGSYASGRLPCEPAGRVAG
jgi:hypothetical protein